MEKKYKFKFEIKDNVTKIPREAKTNYWRTKEEVLKFIEELKIVVESWE